MNNLIHELTLALFSLKVLQLTAFLFTKALHSRQTNIVEFCSGQIDCMHYIA